MCLFAEAKLPTETLLRIWDSFFLYGVDQVIVVIVIVCSYCFCLFLFFFSLNTSPAHLYSFNNLSNI